MFYEPKKHTTQPDYVGSSVIGMIYDKGIIIATDTRLNYGGLGIYHNVNTRVTRVNENTILGSSGEYSDFQEVTRILAEETLKDTLDSKAFLGPNEITNYLSAICYYRRNKMDPYLNSNVIGGIQDNKPVLYNVDQFGTKLTNNYFATGFGNYFCQSIIETDVNFKNRILNRNEAIELIERCFKVLYFRDTRAGNNIKYGYLEKEENEYIYEEFERSFRGTWDLAFYGKVTNNQNYV
jgi:20S proteasome subunit beta 7